MPHTSNGCGFFFWVAGTRYRTYWGHQLATVDERSHCDWGACWGSTPPELLKWMPGREPCPTHSPNVHPLSAPDCQSFSAALHLTLTYLARGDSAAIGEVL